MPKVQLSNNKGLVQKSGKGFEQSSAPGEVGFHRWVEELSCTNASAINDVVARLGMYIPAQARVLNAHIIGAQLLTSADGSVALEVHSADVAVDAASAGTEIVGDAAGGSLPLADLNVGSGDVLNDNINMGTLAAIDRGADASYFQLAAKEDMSAATGTAKVVVVVEWFGPAAISL